MKQRGFSLIELMIVIAIIGVLAAIATPAYQNYITKSRLSEVFSLTSGLKSYIVESYTSLKRCPDNSSGIVRGVQKPSDYATAVIDNITVSNSTGGCDINTTIKANAPVASSVRGKVITLSLIQTSGAYYWNCSSNFSATDSSLYLPALCN